MALEISLHKNDLPNADMFKDSIAIDTEAMGLYHHRDRLCLVQLCDGKGNVHLVQIEKNQTRAPHLENLLQNQNIQKIFHFARFDVALLMHTFNIQINNVYCTKIASKLCRTYTNKHGLKDLCKDLLKIELSKEEQTSDWGAPVLNDLQKQYAACDVLHLHDLKNILDNMLIREDRMNLAMECFNFIRTRAQLDLLTNDKVDIFAHHSD